MVLSEIFDNWKKFTVRGSCLFLVKGFWLLVRNRIEYILTALSTKTVVVFSIDVDYVMPVGAIEFISSVRFSPVKFCVG